MGLPPSVFETDAYANSATSASNFYLLIGGVVQSSRCFDRGDPKIIDHIIPSLAGLFKRYPSFSVDYHPLRKIYLSVEGQLFAHIQDKTLPLLAMYVGNLYSSY